MNDHGCYRPTEKKIPYGEADFSVIRDDGYAFVDKTRFIEVLEAGDTRFPYNLAAALIFGDVSLASFDETHRQDPRIEAMMQRIRFKVDTAQKDDDEPIICVRLKNGQSLQTRVAVPLGAPSNPITDEALMKKFRSVTGLILDPQEVSKLAATLLTLTQCEDLRTSLLPLTVPNQKRYG